ncbi:hypothetical protein DXG01_003689 [Tephrocybe rancida]|nr:hypothetical protein DXG01_003689 [Tephrocybe rancida]
MFFLVAFLTVPFTGILVRYRLAYQPKEILLPAPTDLEAATSSNAEALNPVGTTSNATSSSNADSSNNMPAQDVRPGEATLAATRPTLFGIAKRVYQIEGKGGLYKGILPTLIVNFVMMIFSGNSLSRIYISPAPPTTGQTLFRSLFNTLLYSFALIWVYRSIAVRTKLEIFGTSIKDGIKALFTHHERARPYRAISPALLSALIGHILIDMFIFRPLGTLILSNQLTQHADAVYFMRIGVTGLLHLINTLISAPLDVITTRLAVQCNYSGPDVATVTPGEPDAVAEVVQVDEKSASSHHELGLADNNVAVNYRSDDQAPYTSVYNCATKIIKEEGWGVLYRGWFITFLGKIY